MHSSVARAHALGPMFRVRNAGNAHRRDESFHDFHIRARMRGASTQAGGYDAW